LIHIQIDPSQIPDDWLARAERVTKRLEQCADDDESVPAERRKSASAKRRAIIDKACLTGRATGG